MSDIDLRDSSRGNGTFSTTACESAGFSTKRQLTCPGDQMIAAYVDGGLPQKKRERFQRHLTKCGRCRSVVGDVVKLQREGELQIPPFETAHRAIVFAPKVPIQTPWIWASAAIALLLLLALIFDVGHKPQKFLPLSARNPSTQVIAKSEPPPAVISPVPDITRKLSQAPKTAPVILSPSEDSNVASQQFEISWKPLPRSKYFEISLLSSDGDLLWRGQTKRSSLRLPPDVVLKQGSYFVWITAHLVSGQVAKSSPVHFMVER